MKEKMSRKKTMPENNANTSSQQKPPSAEITEIDMFTSNSSSSNNSRSLSSPVKTNPLMEAEREKKPAQYVSKTPQWCPGLMRTTTTRVLKGEEAEAAIAAVGANR